jgi:hypothetical protein
MNATPAMLASLTPGELLVKITRDGWRIKPDHVAIAQSNQALRNFVATPGKYRGRMPNKAQVDCLEGSE